MAELVNDNPQGVNVAVIRIEDEFDEEDGIIIDSDDDDMGQSVENTKTNINTNNGQPITDSEKNVQHQTPEPENITEPDVTIPDSSDDDCIIDIENKPIIGRNEQKTDTDSDEPIFRIIFKNQETYETFQPVLSQCIKEALFNKLKQSIEMIELTTEQTILVKKFDSEEDNVFMIDTAPMIGQQLSDIPVYEKSVQRAMSNVKRNNEEKSNDRVRKRAAAQCFNCGGEHAVRDCKEKRDQDRIASAINMFKENNSRLRNVERYHVDSDQRYAHLLPGQFSDELKNALGVRSGSLPAFIYRMRMLGYPPGWLEDAKIHHSGITLYNEAETGTTPIDGIEEENYDVKKLISYPGFNVRPPRNFYDETHYYRVGPMRPDQSLESMISRLHRKRRKLEETQTRPSNDEKRMKVADVTEPVNLNGNPLSLGDQSNLAIVSDIDANSNDSMTEVTVPEKPTSIKSPKEQSTPLPDADISINERPISPSLDELRAKQEKLIAALSNSSSILDSTYINSSIEDSLVEDILELDRTELSMIVNDGNLGSPSTPKQSIKTSLTVCSSGTKEIILGVPLLKQISPYSEIPSGDKWSVGVTDVIDFENLPNSIGKYKKMRKTIGKVRSIVRQLNKSPT